ncbi:MAG TPA: Rpn family recombination-promoting nuclease/putative transposase [Bacillota bacterium]|nr:Rpn family recombination-promoting nuclease/putative transposase [Bacillota bacterium]
MKRIHHPHDKLFRETFGDLSVTKDFLSHYLPTKLASAVDMDAMSLKKNSFIKNDLREVQSDLLFRTEISGQPGYIYFLFEHKSFIAEDIAFQLLGYMLEIWKYEREKLRRHNISFIIPLVLYHGDKK